MLSIIITTYQEIKTLEKILRVVLAEKLDQAREILVIAPDNETRNLIQTKFSQYSEIIFIQDDGIGKPAALNLAFKNARGELLILTDGDVILEQGSISKLLDHFDDKNIGVVCGQPISISPKNTILGYWSHFLVYAANKRRMQLFKAQQYFDCSGYLYTIRAGIVGSLENNVLADDAYISQKIYAAGYKIIYEPDAKVYVKYPNNFSDWIKQKKRSTAGARKENSPIRNFKAEAWHGFKMVFKFPKSFREVIWLILLFLARIYLWLLVKFSKRNKWDRVESTK